LISKTTRSEAPKSKAIATQLLDLLHPQKRPQLYAKKLRRREQRGHRAQPRLPTRGRGGWR
jgi:hypothetical protein